MASYSCSTWNGLRVWCLHRQPHNVPRFHARWPTKIDFTAAYPSTLLQQLLFRKTICMHHWQRQTIIYYYFFITTSAHQYDALQNNIYNRSKNNQFTNVFIMMIWQKEMRSQILFINWKNNKTSSTYICVHWCTATTRFDYHKKVDKRHDKPFRHRSQKNASAAQGTWKNPRIKLLSEKIYWKRNTAIRRHVQFSVFKDMRSKVVHLIECAGQLHSKNIHTYGASSLTHDTRCCRARPSLSSHPKCTCGTHTHTRARTHARTHDFPKEFTTPFASTAPDSSSYVTAGYDNWHSDTKSHVNEQVSQHSPATCFFILIRSHAVWSQYSYQFHRNCTRK